MRWEAVYSHKNTQACGGILVSGRKQWRHDARFSGQANTAR